MGHHTVIKGLHFNCGGKYLSTAFNQHLAKARMARKLTTHDTLQLNGIVEWLNCTLLKCICTFMHVSGLPKLLWGKVLWHVIWLKNRMATRALNSKMQFKVLYGQLLDLSAL